MYKNLYFSGILLLSIGAVARPGIVAGGEPSGHLLAGIPPTPSRIYHAEAHPPAEQQLPTPSITSGNEGTPAVQSFQTATVVDDQITITGTDNISNPKVYIDNGFYSGDVLAFPGTLPSDVTVAYNSSTGALSFTGTATPAQWQAVFRQVTFRTTSSNKTDRTIKYVLGDMVSLLINGRAHYYEYVRPSTNPSWVTALSSAASRSLYGMQGYLATITSQTENDFIKAKLLSDGWVGGSDDYQQVKNATGTNHTNQSQTEGKWYWITGPEKGTPISTGNNTPVAVNGAFMNWASGEPNNSGNEHYMQLYSSQNGKWNDLPGSATGSVPGYVVEYGGYPSDPVLDIQYSRVVKNIPAAPVISYITDDLGQSNSDKITSDRTLRINGTAPANSSVNLTRIGTGVIGTASAGGGGAWSFDYTGTSLADGTYQFTATTTVSGVESPVSNTLTVVIDATAPDAPETPALLGSAATVTTAGKPSFQGTAEPNAMVKLYSGSSLLATVYANASGEWTAVSSVSLPEGTQPITATATDIAGNTSALSPVFNLLIDHTAPATPTAPQMTDGDGRYTNKHTPHFTGSTEAHATVDIYNGGVWVAAVTADSDGKWSYTFDDSLIDGDYTITTRSIDAAGNASAVSPTTTITIDTQAPGLPATPVLTGGQNGYTSDNTPLLTGTAEANATVTIYHDSQPIGTVVADGLGNWSYELTTAVPDSDHEFKVTATDAAGNTSVYSDALTVHVDTLQPEAPDAFQLIDDHNGYSHTNKPTLTGRAEAGTTVTIYNGEDELATVVADENGSWSYSFTSSLPEGQQQITATAMDPAHNTSELSSIFNFVVDTQAPPQSAAPVLNTDNNGGIVKTGEPSISGSTEPNASAHLYIDGVLLTTVITDENGNWDYSFDPSLTDGTYEITVKIEDAAGNIGPESPSLKIEVDTKAPGIIVSADSKNVKGPFTATFTFDEPVENFSSEKIVLVNATASNLVRISETEYSMLVTPLSDRDVKVQLGSSAAFDLAGNGTAASNTLIVAAQFSAEIREVYPNPASSVLHVRFAGIVSEKCRVRMVKATGQIVLDQPAGFVNNVVTLNVSHLSSGIYTLIIISNNKVYQKQVMIGR